MVDDDLLLELPELPELELPPTGPCGAAAGADHRRSGRAVDLASESETTKKLYGIGEKTTDKNGRACLLARRLSEAGVRFVQVTMDGWDHHGDIRGALPKSCAASVRKSSSPFLPCRRSEASRPRSTIAC